MGKQDFLFAWALDQTEAERERGVTIDVGVVDIRTKSKKITVLDCPGHKDFVPKMISGASQADYAIIVIDARGGSFESGFDKGGQTKEHSYLVKALGVQHVIVAVNKMDVIDWNKQRFDEIRDKFLDYLLKVGFLKNNVTFVPIAAFKGENLSTNVSLKEAAWWKGENLMQLIENLPAPHRNDEKPIRFTVSNMYHKTNEKGLFLQGKVDGGIIDQKEKLVIMPSGILTGVKKILREGTVVNQVVIGQNAELVIVLKDENEERHIK